MKVLILGFVGIVICLICETLHKFTVEKERLEKAHLEVLRECVNTPECKATMKADQYLKYLLLKDKHDANDQPR